MDCYIGEIRIFAGNYAPENWHLCDGTVLPINSNEALFSLLGTTYGGNGTTDFALPDLRGRAPVHVGQGTGLSNYGLGQQAGAETVTLNPAQAPAHTHALSGSSAAANDTFDGEFTFGTSGTSNAYAATGTTAQMASNMVSVAGGGQPHNNLQPFLVVNYIIALTGTYPNRP